MTELEPDPYEPPARGPDLLAFTVAFCAGMIAGGIIVAAVCAVARFT